MRQEDNSWASGGGTDELEADRIMEEWQEQQDQVRQCSSSSGKNLESGESIQFQFETFIFKLNVAIERIAQQIEELQDEQNEDNMFLNF